MMHPVLHTLLYEYAAYACFLMVWAVHFCTALSYRRVARLVRKAQADGKATETATEEPISVILTAHNQAEALRRNLPAILEQEYDEFEVVVVNDASTDDTEDVLTQLELAYPHLRHTFTPADARYVSHKRLSLTLGIKSARHEWLLLTEADCRPLTPYWLRSMSRHFGPDIQMVLGYANYERDKRGLSHKAVFFNLFHQMQYLPWAMRHKAYRCSPDNLAYRKSLFMSHQGFASDVSLLEGATELLANRHSTNTNTAVALSPEAKIECALPVSAKQWRLKRTYYMETRRHFKGTFRYRLCFNLKQCVVPLFYLAAAAAAGWGAWHRQWIAVSVVAALTLLLCALKSVWFSRSARSLGERSYLLSFWWYELRLHVWHAYSLANHLFAPRNIFRRKPF